MGDFNQAISVMEAKLQEALGGVSVSLDTSRAGDHEDCIAIYCVGQKAPSRDSDVKYWKHLNGAHWPLARHYGKKPKRKAEAESSRKQKSWDRWAAAKKRARER